MRTLNANQLKSMLDRNQDILLINVLARQAFEKEHVPGSLSIPVDRKDFVSAVEKEAGGKDREIVVYCASVTCTASPTAAKKLEEAGFTNVAHFEGGMAEWKGAGHYIESGIPAGARS